VVVFMPVYTYQVINPDGSDGETFQVQRAMSDPPLTEHPDTGQPVRRVFGKINVGGMYSEGATKARLSDQNLDRLGFTKYQKVGKGQYEKRAGQGPKNLGVD